MSTYYFAGLLFFMMPFLGIMLDLKDNEGLKVPKVYNVLTHIYGLTIVLTNLAYGVLYVFNLRQYAVIVFMTSAILNIGVNFGIILTDIFIDKENS